jgi:hypothetical protein
MASLWTATHPARTGIHRYSDALSEAASMPAEILREAGFVTCGVFRNGWLAPNFGFSQGFDLYTKPTPSVDRERFAQHNPSAHRLQGSDYDATQAAIQFLRTYHDRRFLLYVHYMDVHQYLYEAESARFGTRLVDAYDNAIHWTGSCPPCCRQPRAEIARARPPQRASPTWIAPGGRSVGSPGLS